MLTHDLLMLAGIALAVLSVILAVVALARNHAPLAAARTFVLGLAALVAATFVNPAPFSISDIPGALSRLMAQSGLDKLTEVPGAKAASDAVDAAKGAAAEATDAVTEAATDAVEAVEGAASDAVESVTGAAADLGEQAAEAVEGAATEAADAMEAAQEAATPAPSTPAIEPPPAVQLDPADGPRLSEPPVSN